MEKKIKVVWVCSIVNEMLRKHIPRKIGFVEKAVRRIFNKPASKSFSDVALWNTNAINAIKRFPNIEIHVILGWANLPSPIYEFDYEGIFYHAYQNEDYSLLKRAKLFLSKKHQLSRYKNNSTRILRIIDMIQPNIVHLMGAENPTYSSSMVYLDRKYPLIVSLQTLMSEPRFKKEYPISDEVYEYRKSIEQSVIRRADYLASGVPDYLAYCKENINPNAILLSDVVLALAEDIEPFDMKKEFDFVYYSQNIEKAFDLVVEALGILVKKYPHIRVNASGSYNTDFKKRMDARLLELGCLDNVIFSGIQKTHEDVLRQICKSRFAVLPLKVDHISGTIRESLAMGLPVVTTITPATPKINSYGETVLLSKTGDHEALSANIMRLLEEPSLYNTMRSNGFKYMQEVWPSNESYVAKWVNAYKRIMTKDFNFSN